MCWKFDSKNNLQHHETAQTATVDITRHTLLLLHFSRLLLSHRCVLSLWNRLLLLRRRLLQLLWSLLFNCDRFYKSQKINTRTRTRTHTHTRTRTHTHTHTHTHTTQFKWFLNTSNISSTTPHNTTIFSKHTQHTFKSNRLAECTLIIKPFSHCTNTISTTNHHLPFSMAAFLANRAPLPPRPPLLPPRPPLVDLLPRVTPFTAIGYR